MRVGLLLTVVLALALGVSALQTQRRVSGARSLEALKAHVAAQADPNDGKAERWVVMVQGAEILDGLIDFCQAANAISTMVGREHLILMGTSPNEFDNCYNDAVTGFPARIESAKKDAEKLKAEYEKAKQDKAADEAKKKTAFENGEKRVQGMEKDFEAKKKEHAHCQASIALCTKLTWDYQRADVHAGNILGVLDGRQDGPLKGKKVVQCDSVKKCAVSFIIHTHGGVGQYQAKQVADWDPTFVLRWGPADQNQKYLAGSLAGIPKDTPFTDLLDHAAWKDDIEIKPDVGAPAPQTYKKGIHWEQLAAVTKKIIDKGALGVFVLLKHCHSGGMMKWINDPNHVKHMSTNTWPVYFVASNNHEFESSADFSLPRFTETIQNSLKLGGTMKAAVMRIKSELTEKYKNDKETPAGVYTPEDAGLAGDFTAHLFFGPQNAAGPAGKKP